MKKGNILDLLVEIAVTRNWEAERLLGKKIFTC